MSASIVLPLGYRKGALLRRGIKAEDWMARDLNLFSLALLRESARDGSGLLENEISNPWGWPRYERARGPATYLGAGPVPWGVVTVLYRWTYFSQGFVFCFASVEFSCSVMSDCLQHHGLQHTRLPCPSPTPRACSDSCPLSRWCHSTISSSVVPFWIFLGLLYLSTEAMTEPRKQIIRHILL